MTGQERAAYFEAFLVREGFAPTIDGDGDVVFKFEGGNYFISIDDDEEYFRLVFPNFWPIEDDLERIRVEEAALLATAETKVAKVFTVRDNVSAAIEIFCSSPAEVEKVFRRSLTAIQAAVHKFRLKMQEEIPESRSGG